MPGGVELNGRDITNAPAYARARLGLARTFQSPLVPSSLTVGETLTAARLAWSPKLGTTEVQAARALARLEADDRRVSAELDTLDRRKLLLACLLMRKPTVLMLDEPCSGLLQEEIGEIDEIIRAIRDETEASVIVVEHRLELLTRDRRTGGGARRGAEDRRRTAGRGLRRPGGPRGLLRGAQQGRMTAALEVRRLSAGYGPVRVLHEIDLSVALGERVGLLGLNGHGKTTLLRAIVGLVGWRRGDIELHGRPVMKRSTYSLARAGVVMIPQGDALFPGLSVRDNLDAGAYPSRVWKARKRRRQLVIELFPRLGARLDQVVGTLSGGERRMVSIGRGLMTDADVYLIDEPSLGLAPGIISALMDSLFSVGVEGGAMIIAEQNRTLIEGRVDRMVHIHGGVIVKTESTGTAGVASGAA